jgi:hypothetical protein
MTAGWRRAERWSAWPSRSRRGACEESESQPQLLPEEVYIKLLLARHSDGRVDQLLDRQRGAYLQRLRDLADQERAARERGREELALLFKGGQLHTEADLKWLDVCVEEIRRRR